MMERVFLRDSLSRRWIRSSLFSTPAQSRSPSLLHAEINCAAGATLFYIDWIGLAANKRLVAAWAVIPGGSVRLALVNLENPLEPAGNQCPRKEYPGSALDPLVQPRNGAPILN